MLLHASALFVPFDAYEGNTTNHGNLIEHFPLFLLICFPLKWREKNSSNTISELLLEVDEIIRNHIISEISSCILYMKFL